MAQISRPFQIALAVVALLALVWVVALRGHSSSETSGSSAAAPAATATAQPSAGSSAGGNAAAPSSVYHGSAPGVGGLTRAVAKAHEAVATAQKNAQQLEAKSAQASSASAPSTSTAATAAPAAKAPAASAPAAKAHPLAATHTPHPAAASRQAGVEAALKHGSIVVILFWNPKGTEDAVVHTDLQRLLALHKRYAGHRHKGSSPAKGLSLELEQPITVELATSRQVASFGSFTRDIQIYSTPTLLVINGHGQVRTLTGAPGMLSIEQATDEARHP